MFPFGDHGYFQLPPDSGLVTGVQSIGKEIFLFTSSGAMRTKEEWEAYNKHWRTGTPATGGASPE